MDVPMAEVCRKHNLSESSTHRWRKKYGNMEAEQLQRLKQLEAENARLRRIVAEQALDIAMLKDLLGKDWISPGLKHEEYNHYRSPSSLGYLTPSEFVGRAGRLPVPEAATLSLQVGTNLGGTSVGCTPCAVVVKDYPRAA